MAAQSWLKSAAGVVAVALAIGATLGSAAPAKVLYAEGSCANTVIMLESTDDGASWHKVSTIAGSTAVNIAASPDGCLWLPTFSGDVLRSCDSGGVWVDLFNASNPNCASLYDMAWATTDRGFAVCDRSTTIYRSDDSGRTWRSVSIGTTNDPISLIKFVNSTHGVAASSIGSDFFITVDGGDTWKMTNIKPPAGMSANFGGGGKFVADDSDPEAPLALLSGSLVNSSTSQVVKQFVVEAFGRLPVFVSPEGHNDVSGWITTRGKAVLGSPPFLMDGFDHAAYSDGGRYVTVGRPESATQSNGVFLTESSMLIVGLDSIYRAKRPVVPASGPPAIAVDWEVAYNGTDCELYSITETVAPTA